MVRIEAQSNLHQCNLDAASIKSYDCTRRVNREKISSVIQSNKTLSSLHLPATPRAEIMYLAVARSPNIAKTTSKVEMGIIQSDFEAPYLTPTKCCSKELWLQQKSTRDRRSSIPKETTLVQFRSLTLARSLNWAVAPRHENQETKSFEQQEQQLGHRPCVNGPPRAVT